jgi:hypothetical protein
LVKFRIALIAKMSAVNFLLLYIQTFLFGEMVLPNVPGSPAPWASGAVGAAASRPIQWVDNPTSYRA